MDPWVCCTWTTECTLHGCICIIPLWLSRGHGLFPGSKKQGATWYSMQWVAHAALLLKQWCSYHGGGVGRVRVHEFIHMALCSVCVVMTVRVWPYVESYFVIHLLVAKIQPWLNMVDWE